MYIGGTHKGVGFSVEHADGNPLTLLEFRQMSEYKDNVCLLRLFKENITFLCGKAVFTFFGVEESEREKVRWAFGKYSSALGDVQQKGLPGHHSFRKLAFI